MNKYEKKIGERTLGLRYLVRILNIRLKILPPQPSGSVGEFLSNATLVTKYGRPKIKKFNIHAMKIVMSGTNPTKSNPRVLTQRDINGIRISRSPRQHFQKLIPYIVTV